MELVRISDGDKTKYMEILLIADEQESMIEIYLYRGEMFALCDGDMKALCIVTQEDPGVYEIKNLVTVPKYQRRGYGRRLISCIAAHYRKSGRELLAGTGDCPAILRFYERCGFERSHIVKNFFIDHYDHLIYEEGKQLVDMIYLKMPLSSHRS